MFDMWPGLKLDGYGQFDNLSSVPWLPEAGRFEITPDPLLHGFTDKDKIKIFKLVICTRVLYQLVDHTMR